ncbi:hypothetical protein XELAEV_18013449mg [Xenopus laevis]|uniref:Uncharacterized protein n=1 Tax=Xenopus laevis TaxID=8355 RepID=A0A974HZ22_XENLA|nr:hypothetical protein XELAEV_18013449mg [Xenopus laevis]
MCHKHILKFHISQESIWPPRSPSVSFPCCNFAVVGKYYGFHLQYKMQSLQFKSFISCSLGGRCCTLKAV